MVLEADRLGGALRPGLAGLREMRAVKGGAPRADKSALWDDSMKKAGAAFKISRPISQANFGEKSVFKPDFHEILFRFLHELSEMEKEVAGLGRRTTGAFIVLALPACNILPPLQLSANRNL